MTDFRVSQQQTASAPKDAQAQPGMATLQEKHQVRHPGIRGGVGYYDENGEWKYGLHPGLDGNKTKPLTKPQPVKNLSPGDYQPANGLVRRMHASLDANGQAALNGLPDHHKHSLLHLLSAVEHTGLPYNGHEPQMPNHPEYAANKILLQAEFPEDGTDDAGKPLTWWFIVQMGSCETCIFYRQLSVKRSPECHNPKINDKVFHQVLHESYPKACPGYQTGMQPARLKQPDFGHDDHYNQRLLAALIAAKLARGSSPVECTNARAIPYTLDDAYKAEEENRTTYDHMRRSRAKRLYGHTVEHEPERDHSTKPALGMHALDRAKLARARKARETGGTEESDA